eukprot:6711957-Karenia_brevis.AAC.1
MSVPMSLHVGFQNSPGDGCWLSGRANAVHENVETHVGTDHCQGRTDIGNAQVSIPTWSDTGFVSTWVLGPRPYALVLQRVIQNSSQCKSSPRYKRKEDYKRSPYLAVIKG